MSDLSGQPLTTPPDPDSSWNRGPHRSEIVSRSQVNAEALENMPLVKIPRFMEHQAPVLNNASRFKVCCCGRRWGKTVLGLIAVIEGHGPRDPETGIPQYPGALYGASIWWVCPTYKISNQIWRDLKRCLKDAWTFKSEVERRIELPGGGSIMLSSTDNPDSLRGSGIDGLVVDEAAFIKEEAWTEALRPSLTDRQGWGIFISTPTGRNWFWKLFERAAKRERWERWQRPTTDNPRIPKSELEEALEDVGPYKYAQEYEAKFITPSQHQMRPEWFQYFAVDPSTGHYHLRGKDGSEKIVAPGDLFRFATVDLATSLKETADFSVITTLGITPQGDMLVLDNLRMRMEGPDHLAMLQRAYRKWHPAFIGIEKTGFQLSVVQAAIQEGLPVRPVAADKDKVSRSGNFMARMAAGTVYARESANWLSEWEGELLSFPNGEHDDQVDTMSMAAILLAERPSRKVLFATPKELEKALDLPSRLWGNTQDASVSAVMRDDDMWDPDVDSYEERADHGSTTEWRAADGTNLTTLLASIDPSFIGDAETLWHCHLALSPGGDGASLSMGRIESWKRVISVVENAPMEIEVPIFEVPLTLKIISPRLGHLSFGACGDLIIALRQVRRFLITSTSVSGLHSASVVQKLVRAGLVTTGGTIDPYSGAPEATGAPISVDKQAYTDLKLAVLEGRVHLMQYGWSFRELSQVEDQGNKVSGIRGVADSVAGVVGYLARYGHYVMVEPDNDYVDLDELGLEEYNGLRY